jgi:hypothetical protein
MLVKLAEFTKLRLILQAGSDELTAEAESHPEAPTALAHLRVAAKIKELDRQIEVLSRKLTWDARDSARGDTSPSSATAKTINFLTYTQ